MPRPGPRPYECVKKPWHSEFHRPIRGGVIQHILRIANEVHCHATKYNKEWQCKFPYVVMKVEQIMYSKANSEAEFTDTDNLSARLNDAINTIIRRDETTETGKFIQPCIEAALVLGCVPVKESRSQQLKNPRKYLDMNSDHIALGDISLCEDLAKFLTPLPPRPPKPSGNPSPKSKSKPKPKSRKANKAKCSTSTNVPIAPKMSNSVPTYHPFYYVNNGLNVESGIGLHPQHPHNTYLNNVLLGRPVGWPVIQPDYVPRTMNLLPGEIVEEGEVSQFEPADMPEEQMSEKDCDLSLRLGPCLDPCRAVENGFEFGDCSSNQQDVFKSFEFPFFPMSEASGKRKAIEGHDDFNSQRPSAWPV